MSAVVSATGSSVRRKRPKVSAVKRVVAAKLIASSPQAIATSPHTTAVTLRGIVTANTTVMTAFFTISSRTTIRPSLRTFSTL